MCRRSFVSAIRRKRAKESGRGKHGVCRWLCLCVCVYVCVCTWMWMWMWVLDRAWKSKRQAGLIIINCKKYIETWHLFCYCIVLFISSLYISSLCVLCMYILFQVIIVSAMPFKVRVLAYEKTVYLDSLHNMFNSSQMIKKAHNNVKHSGLLWAKFNLILLLFRMKSIEIKFVWSCTCNSC